MHATLTALALSLSLAAGAAGPYVNVNTADVAQLAYLPYVGPSLAQDIAEYRVAHGPFKTPKAVCDVPRVPCGPKRSVLPWTRTTGPTTATADIIIGRRR